MSDTVHGFDAAAFVQHDLRAGAAPALEHPRPLELFADSCRAMGLGGNLALATTVYLAATTRVLGRGRKLQAHTFVLGPASSGKSYELEAALEHLPPPAVVKFEGCSPRVLIYSKDDIKHRVLVYAEMDSLPTGDTENGDAMSTALTFLRTLVVNGVATYDVTVKGKDGFETRRHTKQGPATLIVTGTTRIPDEQLASRLHEVEVTVDRARLQSVMAAQGRLLQGGKSSPPDPAIVAAQAYLQALAPLEVEIPFGNVLAEAILAKANTTDPRLTREFLRVAGFTAAHALLCIERRERTASGHVIATLEDYGAVVSVLRELSTVRQFSKSAIETWAVVNTMFTETHQAVSVAAVAKKMLKAHSHVRSRLNHLIQGGALLDARERSSRTAPLLVTPSADSPIRMALPTVDELVERGASPGETASKREQPKLSQRDNLLKQAPHSLKQVNPMQGRELHPLADDSGRISEAEEASTSAFDPTVYVSDSITYRVGDVLPDGRRFLEAGPIFSKRPSLKVQP